MKVQKNDKFLFLVCFCDAYFTQSEDDGSRRIE